MTALVAVHGLDLSLRASGVACAGHVDVHRSPIAGGPARLVWIRDAVVDHMRHHSPGCWDTQLVVIEGYSRGSSNRREEAGELQGVVRVWLHEHGIPVAICAPKTRAKFACGNGNADKFAVSGAAIRQLGYEGDSHDAADALWLREIGLYRLGLSSVARTQYRDDAVAAVSWPAVIDELAEAVA